MRAKIKYEIIYGHREEYPIRVMCKYFGVSKSGYYDYVKRIGRMEKDAPLAEKIRQHQEHCFQTYGYRRTLQHDLCSILCSADDPRTSKKATIVHIAQWSPIIRYLTRIKNKAVWMSDPVFDPTLACLEMAG